MRRNLEEQCRRENNSGNELRIGQAVQSVVKVSGPVVSDQSGVNLPAAQWTRSTSKCCRIGATCIDTSSPSLLPNMALPKGDSQLMT